MEHVTAQRSNTKRSTWGNGAWLDDPCITARLTPLQFRNEDLVLLLRDSAKADLGGSDKTKQEVAKDAAIALDRLSCMLQSFKGNPMDLPLSGLQLMRVARSLARLHTMPGLQQQAWQAGEDLAHYVCFSHVMHNGRFAVWSGMLLGLASLYAEGHCPRPPPKFMAVAEMAVEDLSKSVKNWVFAPGMGAKSISQLFWALAKMGYEGDRLAPLVDLLEQLMPANSTCGGSPLSGANTQDLSMLLWSLAKLLPSGARCVRVWSEVLASLGHAFLTTKQSCWIKCQDISNAVWALGAVFGQRGMELPAQGLAFLDRVSTSVRGGAMQGATAQEWTNLLWGFGRLKASTFATRDFLQIARRATHELLHTYLPQGLSNSVWALASLGDTQATDLAFDVMDAAAATIQDFSAQEIGNMCWGVASLIHQNRLDAAACAKHVRPFCIAVADQLTAPGSMADAVAQNWANICWSFATLLVYSAPVFYAATAWVAQATVKDPFSVLPIDISTLALACAAVGHDASDPHLRQLWAWAERLCKDVPSHLLDEQFLCNLLYFWAVLATDPGARTKDTDATARFIFDLVASKGAKGLTDSGLTMLAQAHIEACDISLPGGGIPSGTVRDAALSTWVEQKSIFTCSDFQKEVSAGAAAAGAKEVCLESTTSDGMHRVDLTCLWPAPHCLLSTPLEAEAARQQQLVEVCIECDGPYHFLVWPASQINGATKIRDAQLARRFPVYVAISLQAWKDLPPVHLPPPHHHHQEQQQQQPQQPQLRHEHEEEQKAASPDHLSADMPPPAAASSATSGGAASNAGRGHAQGTADGAGGRAIASTEAGAGSSLVGLSSSVILTGKGGGIDGDGADSISLRPSGGTVGKLWGAGRRVGANSNAVCAPSPGGWGPSPGGEHAHTAQGSPFALWRRGCKAGKAAASKSAADGASDGPLVEAPLKDGHGSSALADTGGQRVTSGSPCKQAAYSPVPAAPRAGPITQAMAQWLASVLDCAVAQALKAPANQTCFRL